MFSLSIFLTLLCSKLAVVCHGTQAFIQNYSHVGCCHTWNVTIEFGNGEADALVEYKENFATNLINFRDNILAARSSGVFQGNFVLKISVCRVCKCLYAVMLLNCWIVDTVRLHKTREAVRCATGNSLSIYVNRKCTCIFHRFTPYDATPFLLMKSHRNIWRKHIFT